MTARAGVGIGVFLLCAVAACERFEDGAAGPDIFAGLRDAREEQLPVWERSESRQEGAVGASQTAPPVRGFIHHGQSPRPTLPGEAPVAGGEVGTFSLNLSNADLADVVRTVLEDGLGVNYAIDPAVSGTVTLRTTSPLTRAQLLPTLEQILSMNDAALVVRNDLYTIVPRDQAGRAAPMLTYRDVQARGLTVRVTPLRYAEADSLRETLDSFAPATGEIRLDPSRNLVFTIGTPAEQETLTNLISVLDADYLAGRSFALLPMKNAAPDEVVAELEAIFAGGRIKFLPVTRMNAVLAVSQNRRRLDEAVGWIRKLDQGTKEKEQIFVFNVRNRRASDLAVVLGEIFGAPVSAAVKEGGALAPGLTPLADGTGMTDDAGMAVDVAAEEALFRPQGGDPDRSQGVVRIAADEPSNALVALATPDGARLLENALRRLDVQPLQVVIEVTLAEVVLNDELEFGVRWFFENGDFSAGFSDLALGRVGQVFPGFNFVFSGSDLRLAINALDDITDVQMLSAPTLMVLDNQVAQLQVGDQVPIRTRSSVSVENPNAPIVSEIELRDTGVILSVRPTVNEGGLVVMEVRQEVSAVSETRSSDVDSPTISQRVLQSSIAVQSGETVAMGGLIRDTNSRGRSGVPGLSDIPVAGALFGSQRRTISRTELLVLITPRVVRDQLDARAATEEIRRKLPGIFNEPQRDGPSLPWPLKPIN